MKIALLSPAGAMHRFSGCFKKPLHYAPLTLSYLAGLIPEDLKADIEIYDESAGSIPLDLKADLIGITAITGTSVRCYKWADYFRSKGIKVVMGGIHPTLMPHEAAEHADAVVIGQADISWPQLLHDFSKGKMNKFYRHNDLEPVPKRPIPRRELLNKKMYVTMNSVEASRGCVNQCNFCAITTTYGSRYYKRPVRDVIEEIEMLPGKDVIFVDVNLIAEPDYSKKLFRELIPLKKWWFGLATADITADKELFELICRSGCKGLLIGFESVMENSLSQINKEHNNKVDYELLMKQLHNTGISVNGTFAFGSDEEDKTVFDITVEKINKLKIDLPRFSIITPFPGTTFYQQIANEGRIIEDDWAMYDVEHCVFRPKRMSPEDLEEGLFRAWKQTYSIPSMIKRLSRLHLFLPFNIASNYAYRSFAGHLPLYSREIMTDNSDIPYVEQTEAVKTRSFSELRMAGG